MRFIPAATRGKNWCLPGGGLEPSRESVVSPTPVFASDTHNAVKERGAFCRVTVFPPPKGKRCTRCRELLPFSAFRPNLRVSSGWSSWCRACSVERTREWRAKNPEKVAEANAARRVRERTFKCRECGRRFRSRRARLTCSEECRRERHRRFDQVRDHASRAAR